MADTWPAELPPQALNCRFPKGEIMMDYPAGADEITRVLIGVGRGLSLRRRLNDRISPRWGAKETRCIYKGIDSSWFSMRNTALPTLGNCDLQKYRARHAHSWWSFASTVTVISCNHDSALTSTLSHLCAVKVQYLCHRRYLVWSYLGLLMSSCQTLVHCNIHANKMVTGCTAQWLNPTETKTWLVVGC